MHTPTPPSKEVRHKNPFGDETATCEDCWVLVAATNFRSLLSSPSEELATSTIAIELNIIKDQDSATTQQKKEKRKEKKDTFQVLHKSPRKIHED